MDLPDSIRFSGFVVLLSLATTIGAAEPGGLGEQILDLRARNVDGGGDSPLRSRPDELAEAVERLVTDPPHNHFHPAPAIENRQRERRLRDRRPDNDRKEYRPDSDLPPQRSILRPTPPQPQTPTSRPPHLHETAGPRRLLQETAFQLETLAHRLEMHELYDQADSLRKAAGGLRKEARKQGRRHGDPGPPHPGERPHPNPGR